MDRSSETQPQVGENLNYLILRFKDKMSTRTYSSSSKCKLYFVQVSNWAPALSNQTLLCDIQIEHVQGVVDSFDLSHFDEPHLDVFGGCHQYPMTVVLCLPKHLFKNMQEYSTLAWYLFASKLQTPRNVTDNTSCQPLSC